MQEMERNKLLFNYYIPFFSTLILGLTAHMFMLTNKISFGGDAEGMFEKGATVISGRYGIELTRFIMPDISMPWFNGLLSLVLISAAVCIIITLFDIKNLPLQIILGGLFICSPAECATLCYMFTCAPYALSLLMAVCSVYVFEKGGRQIRWPASVLLLILSCSIYQGYFAFASSFCVIILIKELLYSDKSIASIFWHGVRMFAMLVVSASAYGISAILVSKIVSIPLLDAINSGQSIVMRVLVAYSAYLNTFLKGYFAYVNSTVSLLLHIIVIAAAGISVIAQQFRCRDIRRTLFLCLCIFLFPLSCYCLYLLSDNSYIHSLALYPFCSLYVLLAVIFDNHRSSDLHIGKKLAPAVLSAVLICNICFANEVYFLSYLQLENRITFYSSVITSVTQTEGFDSSKELALVGDRPALENDLSRYFNLSGFQVPSFDILHKVHAEGIINNYLGFLVPFADDEEVAVLAEKQEVKDMPVYPYYGSVKQIDDFIVVKLQ